MTEKCSKRKKELIEKQALQVSLNRSFSDALFGEAPVADTRDLSHARQIEAAVLSFAEWCSAMSTGDQGAIDSSLGKLVAHAAMASQRRE